MSDTFKPEALPNIATPEGDNEFAPDQPLAPLPDDAALTPPSDQAEPPSEEAEHDKPKGIEKFIDEVVRGEYM